MSERPLVAFTLLAQIAVGAFLTLGAVLLSSGPVRAHPGAVATLDGALLLVGAVMVAALAVSLRHLGSRRRAWQAVRNVRTSWLSREVLYAVLFAVGGAVVTVLRVTASGPVALRTVLAAGTALAGVALVHAMARVYRLRTLPAWDTPLTTVSFFATALLLGTLAVGTALVLMPDVPAGRFDGPLRGIAVAAAVGFLARLAGPGRGRPHAARRALLAAGLLLVTATLVAGGRPPALLVAAFLLALASEVRGRYLFYVEGTRKLL